MMEKTTKNQNEISFDSESLEVEVSSKEKMIISFVTLKKCGTQR